MIGKLNLFDKYNERIYRSSCGSSCSPTYYYHPEKAYDEAHKIWHTKVLEVFEKYEKAIDNLGDSLEKVFKEESVKIEMVIAEQIYNLKVKAIELEDMEEESEEILEKKKWLDEIVKEINSILEIE
ncbi:MAG: hypothetical protein ACRC0R_01570 [Cetobacterium sp.]